MPSGQIAPSAPPASMTSASSSAIIRAASPIAWAPVEHAVTTAWFGPIRPYLIETWPEIRLISRPWTKCGRYPARALFVQHDRFRRDARQAADSRTDRATGAKPLFLGHVGQAGIFERLAGGVDAIDDERIDLALHLVIDARIGVERNARTVAADDLAGDSTGIIGRIEARDRRRTRFRRQDVGPDGFDIGPQRALPALRPLPQRAASAAYPSQIVRSRTL